MDPLLSEQVAYYDARAPEYDDWWFRRACYALAPEDAQRWSADVIDVEAALNAFSVARHSRHLGVGLPCSAAGIGMSSRPGTGLPA